MTKVKLQPEVQYGAHRYHIYHSEMVRNEGYDGTVNHRLQEIYIDPTLPATRKMVAFIHENLHIIVCVWDLDMDDSAISRVSEGITNLLQQLNVVFDWSLISEKGG